MTPERKEIIDTLIARHKECVETMEYLVTKIEDIRSELVELRALEEQLYDAVMYCVSDCEGE